MDLELLVPAVHDAARSPQNPLLLLVEVGTDFDTPPLAVLRQILQPGILAQNRPYRVAVLTTFTQESKGYDSFKIILKFKSASSAPTRDVRPKPGFWRSPRLIHCLRSLINSISREMRHFLDHSEQRGIRQRWLHTFTFITGEPNEFLREIHIRMPVILREEDYDAWLSREAG